MLNFPSIPTKVTLNEFVEIAKLYSTDKSKDFINGILDRLLKKLDKELVIEIQDTGQGMSDKFIKERLFRPFESTKSAGMGIGVFESREYVQELGGRLEVTSTESVGTTFQIILKPQEII